MHRVGEWDAKAKPFHIFRALHVFVLHGARVIACPLMFSTAGIKNGTGGEPAPKVNANGIGLSMWAASTSLFTAQSRTTAQPAALRTFAFKPCFE